MLRPARRIDPARSWQLAREQYAAVVSERDLLRRQLEITNWHLELTRQSLDEVRSALQELRAAVLARQKAEDALRELYRERAIARARASERDPNAMLN
jgi:chromosome segregation ATPase